MEPSGTCAQSFFQLIERVCDFQIFASFRNVSAEALNWIINKHVWSRPSSWKIMAETIEGFWKVHFYSSNLWVII